MDTQKNVLFIVVDCLRSDFSLGEFGNDIEFFTRFREEGTCFPSMISTASTTTPAVASLMTGEYHFKHGIQSLTDFKLKDSVETLAEFFSSAGYSTLAHTCGPVAEETGLDAGFDRFEYREREKTVYTDWWDQFKSDLNAQSEPWFTYLHLWEVHTNRDLPSDTSEDELPYRASIRGLAEKLEELFEIIDTDETIIALTGDHGESIVTESKLQRLALQLNSFPPLGVRQKLFDNIYRPVGLETEGLHNGLRRHVPTSYPTGLKYIGHGYHVYDFLVKVPFAILGESVEAGQTIEEQVRHVDIFPTITEAAGLESPSVEGQSLLTDNIEHRPAYLRACGAVLREEANWLEGIRYDGYKFVRGRERNLKQLYDLSADPDEQRNILKDEPETANRLETKLNELIAAGETDTGTSTTEEESKMRERLEDLGYL